jgi:hypothetical protein
MLIVITSLPLKGEREGERKVVTPEFPGSGICLLIMAALRKTQKKCQKIMLKVVLYLVCRNNDIRTPAHKDSERGGKEVGRGRFGLPTPAMSRRYPNQARPPALYTECKNLLPKYML